MPSSEFLKDFLTVAEFVLRLKEEVGVSYSGNHIRRLIRDGRIEARKFGERKIVISRESYIKFVSSYRNTEGGGFAN